MLDFIFIEKNIFIIYKIVIFMKEIKIVFNNWLRMIEYLLIGVIKIL